MFHLNLRNAFLTCETIVLKNFYECSTLVKKYESLKSFQIDFKTLLKLIRSKPVCFRLGSFFYF